MGQPARLYKLAAAKVGGIGNGEDQITIDGLPAAQWIGTDILSNAKADVQHDHFEMTKSSGGQGERPVKIDQIDEMLVPNALAEKCE